MKSYIKWYTRPRSRGESAFLQKYMTLKRDSKLKLSETTALQRAQWEKKAREYATQYEPLIERVDYISDYSLLVYQTGEIKRVITLRPFINFKNSPLADLEFFKKVQVLNDQSGIFWPDGTTICNFEIDAYDVKWFEGEKGASI